AVEDLSASHVIVHQVSSSARSAKPSAAFKADNKLNPWVLSERAVKRHISTVIRFRHNAVQRLQIEQPGFVHRSHTLARHAADNQGLGGSQVLIAPIFEIFSFFFNARARCPMNFISGPPKSLPHLSLANS